jgi:cytochrome c peroxidase
MVTSARWWIRGLAAGSAIILLGAAAERAMPRGPKESPDPVPKRVSYEYGRDLFFHETFGGNGRVCATCHEPRNEFTISPALVQKRYDDDPTQPLFRPVDSDDGEGRDYTTLRTLAAFNVTISLHPNVWLVDDPTRRAITVRRGVPTIANVALTAPYLQDGRGATLQEQAAGAIHDHMQPSHPPQAKELDALKLFEEELYYPLKMRVLDDTSDPVPLDPGFSLPLTNPAALRGQKVFNRHCVTCHGGETGDRPSNPSSRFSDVAVSETNRPGFPLLHLAFRHDDGTIEDVYTPDPGRAAITGDIHDLNSFDTPPLRGLKHTAPYFHDNSAMTLRAVIDHYNAHFPFLITPAERDDLLAYLETL